MEFKQIVNFPLYFISEDGKEVIRLCRVDLYKKIRSQIYRRANPSGKYKFSMPDDKYLEYNGLVFRRIKQAENQFGYKFLKLTDSTGERHTVYVHRIMYRTFVGVIPSNMEINHIDHDKSNNSINNLELVTHEENLIKAVEHYGNKVKPRCKQCGKVIYIKSFKSEYCSSCLKKRGNKINQHRQHKFEHPPKDVLWELLKTLSFSEIGRLYNVSDTCIIKLAKKYGLPFRRRDIERLKENMNLQLDSHRIGED